MAKRKFKLSEQAINELRSAYQHSRQGQARTRFQAVRLYGEGYPVAEIAKICGCAASALMVWCRSYRQEGIAGLLDRRQGGNHAKLSSVQIEMMREVLHTYTPAQLLAQAECVGDGQNWTVPDLARLVKQRCGVVYQSDNSYRTLLRKCGFTRQRPGLFYKSRSERAVIDFEEVLEKVIDLAQEAPDSVILAGDEASLYLQATLKVVWHPCGQTPVLKVHPGHDSTHFYGALNLRSGQETALRSQMMKGDVSVLFLLRLLETYPDQPILLLWDRATWHRRAAIQHILDAHPRLEILYLPAAAPDLNPQEQVWKATRRAVSHNHRHAKLDCLADAFEQHLTSTRFPCSLLDKLAYPRLCAMFT